MGHHEPIGWATGPKRGRQLLRQGNFQTSDGRGLDDRDRAEPPGLPQRNNYKQLAVLPKNIIIFYGDVCDLIDIFSGEYNVIFLNYKKE